jgi:hypothetical protein
MICSRTLSSQKMISLTPNIESKKTSTHKMTKFIHYKLSKVIKIFLHFWRTLLRSKKRYMRSRNSSSSLTQKAESFRTKSSKYPNRLASKEIDKYYLLSKTKSAIKRNLTRLLFTTKMAMTSILVKNY